MSLWKWAHTVVLLLQVVCASRVSALNPTLIYDGGIESDPEAVVSIRIGTGGAGQSGILQALADAFIVESTTNGSAPFRIAWYQSDTFETLRHLGAGVVDIGITYNEAAERIAVSQGVALDPVYYAWRDHFLIVGHVSNPARLDTSGSASIMSLFTDLYIAAEATVYDAQPVRFLTRFDKSATNMKESSLWISISQAPWAMPYSTWYHQYIAPPVQALTAAIQLGEYTLTDRGTFLTLPPALTQQLAVFKAATDDPHDPLLNPAHLLLGARARDPERARAFAEWMVRPDGGQQVIRDFEKNGQALYTEAPRPPLIFMRSRTATTNYSVRSNEQQPMFERRQGAMCGREGPPPWANDQRPTTNQQR